jgi:glycosyltransferase involved in cell wall biosynthesis
MIDWFTPGYKAGGPIQSCANIAFALKEEYDVYVLTTDTDHGDSEPYPGIESNKWISNVFAGVNVYYIKKATLSFKQLSQQINIVQPDYIYLNSMFSPYFVLYPLWLKYKKRINSTVIVSPRGSLYDSALSVKPYKKIPFLYLLKWLGIPKRILFHATNEREQDAIKKYFPGSIVRIADNLPNINQAKFVSYKKEKDTLKCIFIARIVAIKNLFFLLNVLEKVKSTVQLTVIGPVEDAAYWDQCTDKIRQLPENITVNYEGTKPNDQLLTIIQQHHLFVLPTTGENFGHAIFEAMLAGRPVLISDQTPWLQLDQKKIGWDIPLTKEKEFIKEIEIAALWDQQQFDEYADATWHFANNFITNPGLRKQYNDLFT